MNRKGFTLVELLATLVILGIVISIGGVAITKTITNSKQKNYETLVANIKSAVEAYYQECNYGGGTLTCSGSTVKLKALVDNGFIASNDGKGGLINPKNEAEINDCLVEYTYYDNRLKVEYSSGNTVNCPTTDHYEGNY